MKGYPLQIKSFHKQGILRFGLYRNGWLYGLLRPEGFCQWAIQRKALHKRR
jgi:hypothetical protein